MRAWTAAGVSGVIVITGSDDDFAALREQLGPERLHVGVSVDEPVWQPPLPVLVAGPRLTYALIAGSRLPDASMRGQPFDAVALGRTVAAHVPVDVTPLTAANVIAWLPGSDPDLRDEFVLYTAHYDHLGIATPDDAGDSIFNGFSDNAAGVAMLLGIADALRRDPPARSVGFLFLTGEERGLLGASFAAARPPWPLEQVRALINLDAGAPPVPPVSWRIAGAIGTPLGERADSIARANGWTLQHSAARPNSDYWPFNRRGVPTAFIIPGNEWENTSAADREALRDRWDRYHHRDDEWHADFPFAGLARYASFALQLGLASASAR
jgi:Zn-dependent M28 family amino/carboxypeptidase